MWRSLLTLAFIFLPFSAFAAIDCPAPPQQLGHDVVVTTTGKLETLGRLAGGDLSNETRVLAKDLFHDYKDADKVVIANMMISIFCQQLRDSMT